MSPQLDRLRDRSTFLSNTPLWRGLGPADLETLSAIAQPQRHRRGSLLFSDGDPARGFFIVVEGRIKIVKQGPDGREYILQLFGPGEHFAEVPAFDGQAYPATAIALEDSEVLLFPRNALRDRLAHQPELALNVLAIFASRLRSFANTIEDLSLKEVSARLAAYLRDRAADHPTQADPTDRPISIPLALPKGQLAAYLGTSPETLSRLLGRLERHGILHLQGNTIRLRDRDRLEALAAGQKLPPLPSTPDPKIP